MGYFSNGTEGEIYQDKYCQHCAHWPDSSDDGGCHVWLAQLIHNYDQEGTAKSVLNLFIPRSEDGLSNLECEMFWPKVPGPDPDQEDMFRPPMKEDQ